MDIVCSGCKGKHHQSVCKFRNAGNNNSCNSNMNTRNVNMNNFNTGGVLVNGRQTTACGRDMVGSKQLNNGDTSAILNLSQANSILLQTARANVMSKQGNKSARTRILFDLDSQFSYIIPEARDFLQLHRMGTFNISLKTFGNSNEEKLLELVKFSVLTCDGLSSIEVEAFVSGICYPIVLSAT